MFAKAVVYRYNKKTISVSLFNVSEGNNENIEVAEYDTHGNISSVEV